MVTAIVLVLLASPGRAQDLPFECGFEFGTFKEGSKVFFFDQKVPIHSAPSPESAIIGHAGIGTPATIAGRTEESVIRGGARNYWYQVQYQDKDSIITGFVWGAQLSMVTQRLPGATHTDLLLYGCPVWSTADGFTSTALVLRDGRIISRLTFEPIASGFFDAGVFGHSVCAGIDTPHGFRGVECLVRLIFEYPACGYENGEIFLLWTGEKLYYLAKGSGVSEAGVFRYTYQTVFPDDSGGESNTLQILQEMTEYEWVDDQEKITSHERRMKRFVWDGERVNEYPEEILPEKN